MKMALRCKVIGIEDKVSVKTNNRYTVGLFVQGVQTMNFIIPQDLINDLELYKEYDIVVDYNPAYKNFQLLGLIN